jgi:voltage-gated potassium channel Kch
MSKAARANELKSTSYEVFIAILSVLSIFNLVWSIFTPYEQVAGVLDVMNAVLTTIFMIDFLMRFLTADSKSHYFWKEAGWADLLASLPFKQTKIFRVFRLFRAYRLTRKIGLKRMMREMIDSRADSVLLTLLLFGILVFQFGSMLMLNAESTSPNANIKTASDALWYTIVTISTVGYGDRYPVTNQGRLVGVVIIITGVGLFGTFTGYLANWFLSPPRKREEEPAEEATPGSKDGAEHPETAPTTDGE